MAAAKALSQALRIPTIGISSLDLLAFPVRYTNRLIVPAIDARRGELFYSFYRQVPGGAHGWRLPGRHARGPGIGAPARGEDCLVVGDGAMRYPEILTEVSGAEAGDATSAFPSAASLVELAHPPGPARGVRPALELEPLYLRKSDAEINWTAAMDRAT